MQLKLSELMNGGLQERVDVELEKIIKNINDPNTDAEAVRSVTVKLTFKPWKDRTHCSTAATVSSTLAKYGKIESVVVMGRDDEKGYDAVEVGKGDLFQREFDTETGEIIDNPNLKNVKQFENKVKVMG